MKKRVFIGSSSEELSTANLVKSILEPEFEVVIWNEKIWNKSIFRLNGNFLTNLLSSTLKFDYGILIGTPDDEIKVRGKQKLTARDNVLFELGLFLGRLGIERCAFLVEKEVNIPTDFGGIKLSVFDKSNLSEKVVEIRGLFRNASVNNLNFFPSSTIATTYYENFLKFVCEHYVKNNGFEFKNVKYSNCLFKIYIPKYLTEDLNIQFTRMKNTLNVDDISFKSVGRVRNVSVDAKIVDNTLILLDFPTTLTGINHAIKNLLPNVYNKNGDEYKMILEREMEKFIDTLKLILKRNKYDDFVKIERIE
jgi:hypothetical protein